MTRRSKREIENRLDDFDPSYAGDYPSINLAVLISSMSAGEYEDVEGKPLVRCHGQLYYLDPAFRDNLASAVGGREDA